MNFTIKDGKGTGYSVEVKSNNKLAVESVTTGRASYYADVEEASYLISTGGFISLTTTDTETGILHIKYTGNGHLHLTSIRTSGTAVNKWLLYKNVTTGTLISNAVAGSVYNSAIYSSNTLSSTIYKGADGYTVTDGTIIENWINAAGHSTENFDGALILSKNDTLTLTTEVSSAADVCVRILCFEDAGIVL